MKTNMTLITVAGATIVALSMIGCGSSATPATPPVGGDDNSTVVVVIPDYAKKVVMDLSVAKGAVNLVYGVDEGLYDMSGMTTTSQKYIGKRRGGVSYIPYMLVDFLRDFTNKYYGGGDMGKIALRPDDHDTTLTFNCAYSGSYTVHEKYTRVDTGNEDARSYLKEYTFDNCDHNAPVDMEFDSSLPSPQYHYKYSGNLRFVTEESDSGCCPDIETEKVTLEANSFVFSVTENGKKTQDMSASFSASFEMYESQNFDKYDISMDGDIDAAEYNISSGSKTDSFVIKTKEFKYRGHKEMDRYFDLNLDGYAFVAPDMNESHVGYLYGEGFKAEWKTNPEDTDLWAIRFDGIFGTACLGGTVEFETTAPWDINQSMPDFDDSMARPKTPFAGKTTIAGAEKKAEITFGQTGAPVKSWAQIGIVNETPEAKTTITKIMDENCSVDFFN